MDLNRWITTLVKEAHTKKKYELKLARLLVYNSKVRRAFFELRSVCISFLQLEQRDETLESIQMDGELHDRACVTPTAVLPSQQKTPLKTQTPQQTPTPKQTPLKTLTPQQTPQPQKTPQLQQTPQPQQTPQQKTTPASFTSSTPQCESSHFQTPSPLYTSSPLHTPSPLHQQVTPQQQPPQPSPQPPPPLQRMSLQRQQQQLETPPATPAEQRISQPTPLSQQQQSPPQDAGDDSYDATEDVGGSIGFNIFGSPSFLNNEGNADKTVDSMPPFDFGGGFGGTQDDEGGGSFNMNFGDDQSNGCSPTTFMPFGFN